MGLYSQSWQLFFFPDSKLTKKTVEKGTNISLRHMNTQTHTHTHNYNRCEKCVCCKLYQEIKLPLEKMSFTYI